MRDELQPAAPEEVAHATAPAPPGENDDKGQNKDPDRRHSVIRMKQARTVKICGARFKEARVELCNMTLSKAAEALGYANASKLSKIENASDGYPIPLWVLVEASKLYEVSTDFLLGVSDDWERSARMTQEREVSRFQAEQIEKAIRQSCDMARLFNDELAWASGAIIGMAFSLEEVAATFKRVTEINVASWQEVKGGAKLAGEIDKALNLVATARAGLKRFKRKLARPLLAAGE
jgi:hypothetical protein